MRRILLTCTLAFTLLPVFGGEGKAPPMNKEKSLLIDYVDPLLERQISVPLIPELFVRME